MARRKGKQTSQIVFYVVSGLVAFSMILSLLAPLILDNPRRQRRSTPVPTWTPWPTPTPTATGTPVVEGPPAPPPPVAPSPTALPTRVSPPPVGPPAPPTPTPAAE